MCPHRIARRLDFRETGHVVAGEDDPVILRWTLLSGPFMANRPVWEGPYLHHEHAPAPKPRVVVACLAVRLLHTDNRCTVQ